MITTLYALTFSTLLSVQAANPACGLLTADEVASIVGLGSRAIGVTSTPTGASCMYQNGDRVATVLLSKQTSPENAVSLWTAKKRIVQGTDIDGWTAKAYAGSLSNTPVVGLAKGSAFIEVKVVDAKAKSASPELAQKLRTAMKGLAARM